MKSGRSRASTRAPAAAGSFYPSDQKELRASIDDLLTGTTVREIVVEPRLFIVPHAGYIYSGPVAATAYRIMQTMDRPQRLVLVGPAHFVGIAGLATPGVESFATPLGVVPVDAELTAVAEDRPDIHPDRAAHDREHSIEVQLPFLQVVLEQFTFLTLLTGTVEPGPVADVLSDLMEVDGVMGLISSDLSHYLDYDAARVRDERTGQAIVARRPDRLSRGDACGVVGVQAALLLARREGWECSLLDLRSSGDTAGGRDSVVGYGSFVIGPAR